MRRYGKRFFGILLAFCMVISMLPAAAVASAPGHSHCVCGKTDCTDTEHGAAADFQSLSTLNSTLNGAHYYLSDNVTADTDITISGDVTLCLNGKTLSMGDNTITVSGNAVLTICDCGTLGAIIGNNSGSGSLISVTDGGTLQVNSGTLSMEHTGSNSQGIHTVNLSAGSSCSFTNCTVSLTTEMSGFSYSASTVYQEGGSLTAGENAKISFRSAGLQTTGSGALCATGSSQVTLKDGSSIEASHTDGSIAFAAYIGVTASACTADITGGSITGVLMVNGEANISGGSFNYIINYGTLKMTGGTVNSSVGSCIRNQGTAELSNVRITESTVDGIGITNDGEASLTLGDGVNISAYIGVSKGDVSINGNVTIDAVKYGVNPSLVTLTGAPSINGGEADLCISSINAAKDGPIVDATNYTGSQLTVEEMSLPDAHQAGYTGYAIKVPEDHAGLFSLTNGGNFVYGYNDGALRLYNPASHPICGASCSHDTPHSSVQWQEWTPTNSGATLSEGSYYLTRDVTLSGDGSQIKVTGTVYLCLNGHSITGTANYGVTLRSGTVTLSGSPELEGGNADIHLEGAKIAGGSGLTGLFSVHMAVPGVFTGPGMSDYKGLFTSANSGYDVTAASDGALMLSNGFTVSFDPNGGAFTGAGPADQHVPNGGKVDDPGEPAKSGCTFAGWYDGDTLWDFDSEVTGSMTLTAKWITDPTVSVSGDTALTYGTGGTLYAAVTPDSGQNYAYQWACGGVEISGATGASYTIPTAASVGSYDYSCTVTASITGSSVTASASSGVTVAVSAKAYDSASFSISAIGDQAYTGEQITPVPVVKFGGIELANGTDYDLSCSGNVNVGTGTVKINFKGNYSGEAEVEFSIIKASQAAPAAGEGHAIDYAQETIRIEPGYEVFTSPGGGTQISSGSVTEHLGQTLYIRKAETGTHSASGWTEFEVAGRPAAPGSSVTVSGETVLGKGDGSAGVPEGMEYSTDGGQVWTPGPAALTGLEADAVVIVRKQATDSAPHGVEQAYTVPASSTTLSVSFNENGGSEVDDASGLAYGDTITAPATTRGGYTFAGWYDGDAEWDFADGITDDLTLTAKWTLDAPTVVLSADKDSAAYGEELTLTATASHAANVSYAYEWYKGSEKLDGTGSTLSLKNVADTGSYTVTVTATDADGLTAEKTSVAVSVSIGKADPVTTWPTASAIIYGQSLSDSTLTGGSAAEGTFSWKEGNVYPASGSRAYTVVFIPADDENYNSVEAQVTVSVAKKALTPSVSSVNDKTYDGSKDTAGTISLSGAVLGEEPSASGKFSFRDADAGTGKTVDVTVTLDGGRGGNYVLSTETLEASADIRPRTVGLTWDGYENLVYDGEPVGVTAAATGLVGSDTCTVTVQNGDQANAGTYTATADGLDNANYQLPAAGATQDYTIAPRPVVLSWDAGSLTYDGKQHDITATIENLVQGDVCGLTYEGNSKTDAGSYTAKVTALGNGNYTLTGGKNLSCDWSIQRSVISFNVSGSSHIYDGQAKTAAVTQGTGQEQLPEDCYAITYGGEASQVEAGTYDITVTILNPNYCFADGSSSAKVGELVISQRGVAIPEADAAAFTYNGAEQTYNIAASEFYTVSGNVQKDAGSYTVTVSLNDKDNHTWPDGTTDDLSYDFVIAPKPVTAAWMGLRQVYGDGQTVSLLIDGLEAGDSADDAVITGAGTDAGSYELTAALKNYALGPGTATLIIQRKPVIITVTDNIVRPGGEPVILAPGLNESDYAVTYRDKNGNAVPEPSAQGSCTVWVELTSPNYSFSDGSTLAQAGSLTVTTGTPQLYALDFDGGGGSGSTASMRLAAGSTISLPECGCTMEGFGFVGWEYAGKIYKRGDSFAMPGRDVTFTASWRQASGSVSGTVNEAGRPIAGAVVSLWLGSSKLAETGTNAEGEYNFTGLLPGTYNLVVSCGEQNVTNLVEISGPAKLHSFTLPTGITNSRVEVLPGSPDIVVGGLDSAFERIDGEVYTPTDAAAVENGGKVELAFTAEAKEDSADLAAIKKIAGGSTLALSMDYSLSKTVTSGDSVQTTQLDQSSVLLTVILPLDTALQGKYAYSVYRIHNGQAQSLGTSANALGEYFRVSEDKSEIVMYLRCFSTYVVGYEDAPQFDLPIGTAPDIVESEHGSVTVFPNLPAAGTVVTITPRPDEGYAVDRVIVTGEDGSAVELIDNGDGSYSFKSPGGKLKIEVTFRKMSAAADCPRDESCPLSGFSDLDADAWYHDGIHYCLDEGLMAGTGSVIFAPDAATSRAMIVTILWRLQGCPEAAGAAAFTDVAPGAWYAGAVAWAVSEGIAEGYDDGSFRPDDAITREQLAAMLWRYAAKPAAEDALSAFSDGAETGRWARQAMNWAVGSGLITGVSSSVLDPGGQAVRAQAAVILMRFTQAV